MKRLLIIFAAATQMFLLGSCSKENDPVAGGVSTQRGAMNDIAGYYILDTYFKNNKEINLTGQQIRLNFMSDGQIVGTAGAGPSKVTGKYLYDENQNLHIYLEETLPVIGIFPSHWKINDDNDPGISGFTPFTTGPREAFSMKKIEIFTPPDTGF